MFVINFTDDHISAIFYDAASSRLLAYIFRESKM